MENQFKGVPSSGSSIGTVVLSTVSVLAIGGGAYFAWLYMRDANRLQDLEREKEKWKKQQEFQKEAEELKEKYEKEIENWKKMVKEATENSNNKLKEMFEKEHSQLKIEMLEKERVRMNEIQR